MPIEKMRFEEINPPASSPKPASTPAPKAKAAPPAKKPKAKAKPRVVAPPKSKKSAPPKAKPAPPKAKSKPAPKRKAKPTKSQKTTTKPPKAKATTAMGGVKQKAKDGYNKGKDWAKKNKKVIGIGFGGAAAGGAIGYAAAGDEDQSKAASLFIKLSQGATQPGDKGFGVTDPKKPIKNPETEPPVVVPPKEDSILPKNPMEGR